MSANRVASDDKFFRMKFKLELKKIASAMSGMYSLARKRGIKGKDHVLTNLFTEVAKTSNRYIGYKYHYLENVLQLRDDFVDTPTPTKMDKKKTEAANSFRGEMNTKISNRINWNVRVNTTAEGCGVEFTEGGQFKTFIIPMMYSSHKDQIGSLGSNKVLVWASPHKHDTYKCWRACYFTFSYNNGNKKYRAVNCFIMKDVNSGITYFHEDYRLCASGMRRAIGRTIAKRIAGGP